MIEFAKVAETCTHTGPVFGCRGCIEKDREAAIRQFYYKSPRPNCPRHGPMMVAEGNRLKMAVIYECSADVCATVVEVPVA